jgi:tetratricopeptide (TPR) repeat protein
MAGVLLSLLSLCGFGQDLGSSNSLFGGKKKSSNAKTAPATTAKKKNPARKPATVTKPVKTRSAPIAKAATKKVVKRIEPRPSTAKRPARKPTPGREVQTAKTESVPVKLPINLVVKPPPAANIRTSAASEELFENLIDDGNTARDERNYPVAEAKYRQAKTVKPADARSAYGLGNLFSDQQRWEEAETAYRSAIQLDPASAIIDIALSYVLSQPVMVPNLADRYEEAEKLARRATELAPSNALAFDQLGVAMELGGSISSETEGAYRNAIRLDSTFAPAYAHLGRLLRRQGHSKESAKAYESAIQRSTNVATMIVVADVMQSEQRFAESEPLLRRAVEGDPRNPAGLMLLGKALTTLGNFAEAETFLRKSLAVSQNGFMPNCLLGSLYARQNKFEMAESALMQALQFVSPNEKRNLASRFESVGDGYMKSRNYRSAERTYRQAVSLDPEKETLAGKLARAQHG